MTATAPGCAHLDRATGLWIGDLEMIGRCCLLALLGETSSSHGVLFALELTPEVDFALIVKSVEAPKVVLMVNTRGSG